MNPEIQKRARMLAEQFATGCMTPAARRQVVARMKNDLQEVRESSFISMAKNDAELLEAFSSELGQLAAEAKAAPLPVQGLGAL